MYVMRGFAEWELTDCEGHKEIDLNQNVGGKKQGIPFSEDG